MKKLLFALALSVGVAACASDGDDNGDPPECMYGTGFVAQFDKSCQTAADCSRVTMGLDCCGTSLYAGINSSGEQDFVSAWTDCVGQLEQCGCPPGQPQAEDGNTTTNTSNIQLDCVQGSCTTFIN